MLRFMRTAAIVLGVSVIATTSSLASAQAVRPLIPITTDTLTLPDARDANALKPLWLGMLSSAVPHSFGTPGCEPSGRVTGMNPIPNHTLAANGLHLPANMRLTLFGFSRDGCAYDAAGGAGLALTIPVKKNVMFMWGGGAIYLPHGGPNGDHRTETEIRAGVVWTTKSGRSYNVGISAVSGSPRVSFGGVF